MKTPPKSELRSGWTTGACATAATAAAYGALLTGRFTDPVTITLPGGQRPAFALAYEGLDKSAAIAGIVKDAGDDPDVTHGALIIAEVSLGAEGSGVSFAAGAGVGTVTMPGLPLGVGEPAINPVPRAMMTRTITQLATSHGAPGDVLITVHVADGEDLATRTWNPRLGIVGGLSILGTTGIVKPYSCSAWIHSIHRGIDVARAAGFTHVAAATGKTSEAAVARLYRLPDHALLDMGDFAGGVLKYLRANPVPRATIAGGFAKITKLAQGLLDLHSGRGEVDFNWLAARLSRLGASSQTVRAATGANTARQVLHIANEAGLPLGNDIARQARTTALNVLRQAPILLDVVIFDREGQIVGRAGPDA